MRTRDWRRAQRDRITARVKRWMKDNGRFATRYGFGETEEEKARVISKAAITPHVCSGPCCGNPRHWWAGDAKYTMQERRAPTTTL